MHWLSALTRAVAAFAATNVDDIFVLTLFFAQRKLGTWRVVLGQYVGIAALVGISLAGFFVSLVIPETWVRFLGLAPIAIGIKKLIEWKRGEHAEKQKPTAGSVLTVSTITFANGGDNIAVYTPLFAKTNLTGVVVTLITFAVMIAIWCMVGYYVGNHPHVRRVIDRFGHILVPFVLIGLGIYIICL